MEIYFSFSLTDSNKQIRDNCTKIVNFLYASGHKVTPINILTKINNKNFLKNQKHEKSKIIQNKLLQLKSTADLIILEASKESIGIGQELSYSLSIKKPIIILQHQDYKTHILNLDDNENCVTKTYNKSNIQSVLIKSISLLQKEKPVRFNLLIPLKTSLKLEKKAKEKKTSKAEIIRSLINKYLNTQVK